jgi:hypothetical protein
MKKLLLVTLLTISTSLFAQNSPKDDIAIIQSVYGKSKKEIVGAYLNLQDPQAKAFWTVYDAYEAERKVLAQKKMQIIVDYADNYSNLTNESADALAKASIENSLDHDKLFAKYYGRTKKAVGAINAAKFIQLEVYMQTTIRSEIQDAIPFIGELENTKI